MGDYWRGGRGPPRHPRDIPSLLDFRYQEQFDRRRDRKDQFAERDYPPWNGEGRDRPREFRDSPPLPPEMNYSNQEDDRFSWRRNPEGRRYDRNYENRDEDLYSSRDFYRDDERRPPYDVQPEFRSRRENQPCHYNNRNIRRNSNSPQRQTRKLKNVVGSAGPSRKENDRRPNSRNSKTEGYSKNDNTEGQSNNKQKESPSDKQARGGNGTKRKGSVDKTPPKNTDRSPSSGSQSGKSTRKGNPRKLARPVEEKKGGVAGTESSGSDGKDVMQAKSSERQVVRLRSNTLEITVKGKEKDGSEAVSPCNVKDKKDALNVQSSTGTSTNKGETLTEPAWLTKLPSSEGDSASSLNKDTVLKKASSSVVKEHTPPNLETTKGTSLKADKEKEDSVKVSHKDKNPLLSHKDKDQLFEQSKGNKEISLSLPYEKNPTEKESLWNSKKAEETLPTTTEKHKELQSSILERVPLLSSLGKTELAPNSKSQNESSVTTDKLLTSSRTEDKQGLPSFLRNSSGKEKTFDSSVSGESRQKPDDTACSSENISSLPWEQREERLRSLLGIKKEPKDSEVTYLENVINYFYCSRILMHFYCYFLFILRTQILF